MLSLDDISGVTADLEIDKNLIEKEYPPMVPGRVAHIDADFLAYMASYERKDEDIAFEDIIHRVNVMVKDKRLEAGSEFAVLHLTPNTSDKGGRYEVAIQKQYQGQRTSDDKPRHLESARTYMGTLTGHVRGRAWETAEADDGMSEAAWTAWRDETSDQVVIVTKDKDLRMCPGWHLNWDTGNLTKEDTLFGFMGIKETIKVHKVTGKQTKDKKPIGFGTAFFWMQMLMGDTADHIQGCPKIMNKKGDKLVSCGQVGAYDLLVDATSDKECLRIVMDAYKLNEYTHYLTGDVASWQDVFWSNAQMLWMQRTPGDINDVKKWTKEFLNA
jgi:hypothetical protein